MDIEKLAWIAKMKLDEKEKKELKKEIEKILETFKKIQEVDTSDIVFETISLSNTWFRYDTEPKKFDEEKIIQNFPKRENKKLEVPRLL
ncbi:MAG TPA: Asp-tRNA(Asn)/Glu-tRNA(Gln) amidotransferase subunit GatC [Candidatus Nanopusillus sp.]|nr:Asp-tRNA(Asn)/Glu-tRNA(Gln) amidotransferase subunit GatC [Candidatus Nanopusillus sp.]